jgi:hypothetical protein
MGAGLTLEFFQSISRFLQLLCSQEFPRNAVADLKVLDIELNMRDIHVRDESGVEVKTTPTGRYTTSVDSKPAGSISPGTR